MTKVVIDTSVMIEMSRTGQGSFIELMQLASKSKIKPLTSAIVVAEYWAGTSMNKEEKVLEGKILFEKLDIVETSLAIAKLAGKIKRQQGTHIADALIAATALEQNAQLATLNAKHFENIPGLKIWKSK